MEQGCSDREWVMGYGRGRHEAGNEGWRDVMDTGWGDVEMRGDEAKGHGLRQMGRRRTWGQREMGTGNGGFRREAGAGGKPV